MSVDFDYAPPRDLASKVRRKLTQWRPARPATLRFDEPLLSICFDDFPQSAAEAGGKLLEKYGARGTFYAAAGMAEQAGPCGMNFRPAELNRLAAAGHEIGCHSYDHADCARRDVYDTLVDLAKNRDALAGMGYAGGLRALAYPYGETSQALKPSLPPRFLTARGIAPGLNTGRVDLAQLRAYPLYGEGGLARAHRALKRAAKRNAWMIAFTHDVSEAPSPFGTTPQDLERFILAARDAGVVIAPVSAAFGRAK